MSEEGISGHLENPRFFEFVNEEFRRTLRHATLEELAEFAFGSMNEAIEAYDEQRRHK